MARTARPPARLAADPTNPGVWLAVEGLAWLLSDVRPRLAAWQSDVVEIAVDQLEFTMAINGLLDAIAAPVLLPAAAGDPVIIDIQGRLLCLDWHCTPERSLTGRRQLRLISGQVTIGKRLARLAEMIRPEHEGWMPPDLTTCFGAAQDRYVWLLDARGAWRALDVGFSPDAVGLHVFGSAITELLAMVGAARANYQVVAAPDWGALFCYRVGLHRLYAPLIARGRLRALGHATSSRDTAAAAAAEAAAAARAEQALEYEGEMEE